MISRRAALGGGLVLPALAHANLEAGGPEAWVRRTARQHRLPGGIAVVTRGGRNLMMAPFGEASVPWAVPVSASTRFHIASNAKHITAAAVLRLCAQHRLRLDDPIGAHLDGLPPSWRDRPIHTLLTHTSGIPDYEDLVAWDRPYSREDFLRLLSGRSPDFGWGEAWSYSNTAYVLLGWLVEAVTGEPLSQHVTTGMFASARLPDARFDDAEAAIPRRAEPYVWTSAGLRHAVRMNGRLSAWGDGGVLMSGRDLAPWNAFLETSAYLPPQMRRLATTPVTVRSGRTFPYGCGWSVEQMTGGRTFLWHAGNVPGFTSFLFRAPADGLAVLVLSNAGGNSRPQRFIGLTLAERFAPGTTPFALPVLADPDPILASEARAILFRGTAPLEANAFAPELRVLIEGRIGASAVMNLGADRHELKAFELVGDDRIGADRRRRYRLTYDTHTEHVTFGHAPDGKIYFVRLL